MDSDKVASALAAVQAAVSTPDAAADKKENEPREASPESEQVPAKKANKEETDEAARREEVALKVVHNKKRLDVSFALDGTVAELKQHLQPLTGIPPAMMKIMIKGLAKDDATLRSLGVTKGAKVMVVGSSVQDVLTVSNKPKADAAPAGTDKKSSGSGGSRGLYASNEKLHKKVLDKGKPEDAMPGKKGSDDPLPPLTPLTGMLNKAGGKVRLTFKLESDQLWISTKERTEKVGMGSIKNIVSEPIAGHEEYHLMAIQLGPTEASRYWVYWVPAQYVEAIKNTVFGYSSLQM